MKSHVARRSFHKLASCQRREWTVSHSQERFFRKCWSSEKAFLSKFRDKRDILGSEPFDYIKSTPISMTGGQSELLVHFGF